MRRRTPVTFPGKSAERVPNARFGVDAKVDRLFLLAQRIAEQTPDFFKTKGPGVGDQTSLTFIRNLREGAKSLFGKDFSEKRVSDEVSFR